MNPNVKESSSPLEIVEAFMVAMETLDYDTALTYVSDKCEYENVPMPDSKVYGPEGIRAILEPFFAPTKENEFLIIRSATSGPVVFLERIDRHLLSDGWIELPVTGVFEVHDGKITLWRDYFNLATLAPMFTPSG